MEQDDKSTLDLRPGVTYSIHSPSLTPDTWHSVWNTSNTEPVRTLVALINVKGQPGAVFDK